MLFLFFENLPFLGPWDSFMANFGQILSGALALA